ncbi:kinase-like domain-containing protein [Aspergillus falconensis]
MRRFERIYDVAEPRYEVIGKLGFGRSSTSFPTLLRYSMIRKHIALKIKADASKKDKELPVLLRLAALLDHFKHDGPNGTHLCLVLPVMISDGEEMTVNAKSHQAAYVQSISKQILLGLEFLHTLDIVHCELQSANIMVSAVGAAPCETLLGPPEFSPVKWLEGTTVDDSAPNYLIATQRPRGQLDDAHISDLLVKVGDLGGVIQDQGCNQRPLIYQNSWNAGIDVWALGCLVCFPKLPAGLNI